MTDSVNQANKAQVWEFWRALGECPPGDVDALCHRVMSTDAAWRGFEPLGDLEGPSAFAADFWLPLLHSFPDLTRKTWLFFGGRSSGRIDGANDGRMWVTGTGVLSGHFARDYLSIPANGAEVNIRWGEFCELRDGRITTTFCLLDLVDLMQQAGYDVLPPSRGRDGAYPPPAAGDGIMLESQDAADSEYSLEHIRRFIFEGLNKFDETDLGSMGMADFFHEDVRWYGPGGIGACLSFEQFESLHQRPWLHAFPDRSVQDLDALIAEGAYSGGPGWNGVIATHKGDYLGHPATGNRVGINGLDWWKRDGEVYIENWVFVDMIRLFRQVGVDLFDRLNGFRQ